MSKNKYLPCAQAVSTHGARGTLKLKNMTDSAKVLSSLRVMYMLRGDVYSPVKVEEASCQKGMVLAKFEGIDSLEDAIRYKGTTFYASREDIPRPDGGYFIADLIGLNVVDFESGEIYGTVRDVLSERVQDIYVVSDVRGGEFMIPAVPEFIRRIDVSDEKGAVYVSIIDGMRGDEK